MEHHDLQTFIDDIGLMVDEGSDDQYEITRRVAQRLSALLAGGCRLPPEFIRPSPVRYLNYPIYIAPDDSWSLASVVWNAGQRTPVHGHETWGVVGVYSGAEREIRYVKPDPSAAGGALTPAGEHVWERGQVTVCCTTDDDVHAVEAVSDETTVGIHVYGGNIGTINRPAYDPDTGAIRWFVSGWDDPAVEGSQPRALSNSRA